jgi:hypothetical protein
MGERSYGLGFALEAGQSLRVSGDFGRQNLDGDVTVQAGIAGAVDFSHSACSDRRDDFVGSQAIACSEGHSWKRQYNRLASDALQSGKIIQIAAFAAASI